MKLLIAEDENTTRNGMERYIRMHTDLFDHIYTASNGQEALDIIFQSRPDILLLDIQMPVMTGIEVMKQANEAGILPATIILSGYDDFKYAQQAMFYGARCYLLKPCRTKEMMEQIQRLAEEIEPAGEKAPADTQPLAAKARAYIQEHYSEKLTLNMVSDYLGISHGYLSTILSQSGDGKGFIDYLNEVRVEHACAYLRQNYFKTYEIAYRVGFQDEKYFTKVFKKVMGMTPSEYKRSGE